MKKITSFLFMTVLCCLGAFAQDAVGTEIPEGKMVTVGTAQAEMIPNQWYFLHQGRDSEPDNNDSDPSYQIAVGETFTEPVGGFVYDTFDESPQHIRKSHDVLRTIMNAADGVNAKAYSKYMVRFVPVAGEEGAYYVQFGNNRYLGNAPADGSQPAATAIQSGNAGKYNFYPIKVDGVANDKGLFGWNKYNMQNRVDNNGGKNSTVVFWAEGELTSLVGNNVWQIFDIVVLGDVDPYNDALIALTDYYDQLGTDYADLISSLGEGTVIGTDYGQYSQEAYDVWVALDEIVANIWNGDEATLENYPELADIEKLHADYQAAWEGVLASRVPLAVAGINAGYYAIKSCVTFNDTEEATYTQEEADAYNQEYGYDETMDGFVHAGDTYQKTIHPIKAIYADGNGLKWDTLKERGDYLWKVETVEDRPTNYRLINMSNNKTITTVPGSQVQLAESDTATVVFDYVAKGEVPGAEGEFTHIGIRSASQAEGGNNYLHAGSHGWSAGNNATGKNGNIVGWNTSELPSVWYLSPVSAEDVAKWMESDELKVRDMLSKADSISAVVPDQIRIAKDITTTIHENDSVVTDASQFYSQYTTADAQKVDGVDATNEQVYGFLLDGATSTYWHSTWEGGSVAANVHYLQINAPAPLDGQYAVKMTRRLEKANGDQVTKLVVKGYSTQPTDETTYEEGDSLATITLTYNEPGETVVSSLFTAEGVQYIRFYAAETKEKPGSGGGQNRGYWHAAEFNVFKAEQSTVYATSQYAVRKAQADAVEAAVAAWAEKGYTAENAEYTPEFVEAYNALVNAYEAWAAVYVDPTALREAIAGAPDEKLFVKGNNPGQWAEGVATPATVVAAAKAYDEACAYTPAQSEQHINAIQTAETNVFAAANKISTDKWYRFSFATEAMYETFGWDKTGAKAGVNTNADKEYTPALFGKTIAAGDVETEYETFKYNNDEGEEVNDTLAVYSVIQKNIQELRAGNELFFFDKGTEFTAGEDLFRFIQATDSSYMIQNKATGLFLTAGQPATLSATPSYYSVEAIGAGANLISYTNVLGKTPNAHVYMHGQRDMNKLTFWNASTLGSNSMMMIEAAESVNDVPATEYKAQYWPGAFQAITMPVDVRIKSGATAYGAELTITETDTTVVLMTSKNEWIPAGSPFILVADLDGDYISYDDQYAIEKAKAIEASENHNWGYFEKKDANEAMKGYYAEVVMDHGMKVDTVVTNTRNLIGTLNNVSVKAGKHIYAEDNGFHLALNDGTIYAGQAYFECDVDPESEAMLAKVTVKTEGEIEIGITEILNKVVNTNGNIYNAAGQLVGKGGLGNLNRLPAGIYFMDGVKVVKK